MPSDQGSSHQGWTNRATYLVRLHLDNSAASHRRVQQKARDVANRLVAADDDYQAAQLRTAFADWLKETVGARCTSLAFDAGPLGGTLAGDLLTDALGRVNWRELARSYIEEARETLAREGVAG